MKKLDSDMYWGVLMNSLSLSVGREATKYNPILEKYKNFDHPPVSQSSGGLYLVEQSKQKGLVVVVNAISEEDRTIKKAEELGAKCFPWENVSGIPEKIQNISEVICDIVLI